MSFQTGNGKAHAFKKDDDYTTPARWVEEAMSLVAALMQYGDTKPCVWEPFPSPCYSSVDTLLDLGYPVVAYEAGTDFFKSNVPECDIIFTNPPFSRKIDAVEALCSFGKPFVCLVPATMLGYTSFATIADTYGESLQIVWPSKKISFLKDGKDQGKPPFDTIYLLFRMPHAPKPFLAIPEKAVRRQAELPAPTQPAVRRVPGSRQ